MFGIHGTRPLPNTLHLLKETGARGVILFRRNFDRTPKQIQDLIRGLEDALERKILVAIDNEGGRVQNFPKGLTIFPDTWAFGVGDRESAVENQGRIEAGELRRLGVDINLAPVCEVTTGTYNPGIGLRSYGRDPKRVAALALARVRALQKAGVSATVKHFPGKGAATRDAHHTLPIINLSKREMFRAHLVPFRACIKAGVHLVMPSHVLVPALDPRSMATFSRPIVNDLLREELAFQGVIISDDLEMGAVRERCSVAEAAVRAAEAGHDLLLICHTPEDQRSAAKALCRALEHGRLDPQENDAAIARIQRLLAMRRPRYPRAPSKEGMALARKVASASIRILRDPKRLVPFRGRSALWLFPNISSLQAAMALEEDLLAEGKFWRERLPKWVEIFIYSMNPSEVEVRTLAERAAGAEAAILWCFDTQLYPEQRALVSAVQGRARSLVFVPMRNPSDAEQALEGATVMTAFGWRKVQLEALAKYLFDR